MASIGVGSGTRHGRSPHDVANTALFDYRGLLCRLNKRNIGLTVSSSLVCYSVAIAFS